MRDALGAYAALAPVAPVTDMASGIRDIRFPPQLEAFLST